MKEARIDLHTHSVHSEDRERLALPYGATLEIPFRPAASPARAYDLAIERGMTHVTLTDHDTIAGCLELLAARPGLDNFICGEEVTCYHRGTMLHVGIYGLTEAHHAEIHRHAESVDRERRCLRWDLPALLRLLDDEQLAYVYNHPVWAPTAAHLDPAVISELHGMFRLIELRNGTRHRWLNELASRLAEHHGAPGWAAVGGSDSHTDNMGLTYTVTAGSTCAEVLASLRAGNCRPAGDHGSHRRLERDTRMLVVRNTNQRAGLFLALADGTLRGVPSFATELLSLSATGILAYLVVREFTRQRELAQAAAELFELDWEPTAEEEVSHAEELVATASDRAVH